MTPKEALERLLGARSDVTPEAILDCLKRSGFAVRRIKTKRGKVHNMEFRRRLYEALGLTKEQIATMLGLSVDLEHLGPDSELGRREIQEQEKETAQ